jgi:hypothetical protein
MSSNFYSLNDIESLLFNDIKYVLPNSIIEIIKFLENELNLTHEPAVPFLDKKKQKPLNSNINSNWERKLCEPPIDFKVTKIETKEGIEKYLNDIRIYLNKLSDKNYETQQKLIVEKINIIINENSSCECQEQITKVFFTIIISNKFFSELYAKLFKDLIEINKFDFVYTFIYQQVLQFKFTIDTIQYVDPNTDYNEYCKIIKINDNRKSLCLFFINLVKVKVLKINTIYDILQYFLEKSIKLIEMKDKSNEVEEITENIYLIISNLYSYIQSINEIEYTFWKNILFPQIIIISQMKVKDYPSLSNRIIFKYMDIIDIIE